MIQSMTGYGKSSRDHEGKTVAVEIRSLNSKQTDIGLRLPVEYRDKEPEIRVMLTDSLVRGKIDCVVSVRSAETGTLPEISRSAVKAYIDQMREIGRELEMEINDDRLLAVVMRFPEVFRADKPGISPEEWQFLQDLLREATDELRGFRIQEGKALENDLRYRIGKIITLLDETETLEKERTERIRQRIRGNLETLIPPEAFDQNRFEQELVYYLEKIDFSEEKSRLRQHCRFFIESLKSPEPPGKKLSFISQEIGREINTLGSKANDAAIQKNVVMMKDELEKVREQLANVL